jgi:hypothetical protein
MRNYDLEGKNHVLFILQFLKSSISHGVSTKTIWVVEKLKE